MRYDLRGACGYPGRTALVVYSKVHVQDLYWMFRAVHTEHGTEYMGSTYGVHGEYMESTCKVPTAAAPA